MKSKIEQLVEKQIYSIEKSPYLWLFFCIIFALGGLYLAKDLKVSSSMQDLLPASSKSVQASEALNQRLGSADILVLTLMTHDFEKVKPFLPELADALKADPDIKDVIYQQDISLIQKNALTIFPSQTELEEALDELIKKNKEEVSKRLSLDLDESPQEQNQNQDQSQSQSQTTEKPKHHYSWGELESKDGLSRIAREFLDRKTDYPEYFYNHQLTTIGLKVYPKKSSSDLDFCKKIIQQVNKIVSTKVTEKFGKIGENAVIQRVDLGGGYRFALEQSEQIKDDMFSSTGSSLALLALVIMIAFRSIRAFFLIFLPLILGALWTLGIIMLTVGYLNMITAFIFAVLLGLGIDFGIHYYGRYREERAVGFDATQAMLNTQLSAGYASILASSTTAAAFAALAIADFKGFSQFGMMGAVGVLCCLLAVYIAFPSTVFIFERWMPLKLLGFKVDRSQETDIPRKHFYTGKKLLLIGYFIAILGFASAPWVEFEMHFSKLGNIPKPETQEKGSYKELQQGTTKATSPSVVFTNSQADARMIYQQLEKMIDQPKTYVGSIQALFSLVPTEDEQNLKIKSIRKICRKINQNLATFEGDERIGADELLKRCQPEVFGLDALPSWITNQFTDKNGKLGEFIFISPRGNTSNGHTALAFYDQMQQLKDQQGHVPLVSGKTMVWAEVLMAMKKDGVRSFSLSLLVVLILIYYFEKSLKALLLISIPLVIGLGVTIGTMVLFDIKLNFFNMLALPTLIGMGVDDGVHLYHRYKELGPWSMHYLIKNTGLSAFLTTFTTMIGFGSLMSANHYGLISLGLLTNIGMFVALVATLLFLPSALQWMDELKHKKGYIDQP